MEEDKFLMRNYFNRSIISKFTERVTSSHPEFDGKGFLGYIDKRIDELSFMDRLRLITEALHHYLPKNFPDAVTILLDALHPAHQKESFDGLGIMVLPQAAYVSKYGLEHFDLSMNTLYEMTKRASAEFEVRYFIIKDQDKALAYMHKWAVDPDPAVRRLASEGSRSRLPWGVRLQSFCDNPAPVIAILEKMKHDPDEVVRRSVANNINDIAKDHPDTAADLLIEWSKAGTPEIKKLVKHASRTLVKMGHPKALALSGASHQAQITFSDAVIETKSLNLGETLIFSFSVTSVAEAEQNLIIDYIIRFKKANGSNAPKVFKLTARSIGAGEKIIISKKHRIHKITTREYYPGEQFLDIQINGKVYPAGSFILHINQ